MASIAKIVEEIVLEQPFLADALQRAIVNYGAVADELLPRVQKETKEKVRHAAVMMALRRLAEKLERRDVKAPRFGEESDVTVRSNLFELTVGNTKRAFDAINDFRSQVAYERGEIFTVTHGLNELTVISNRKHLARLRESLRREQIKNVTEELSLLTVRLPQEAIRTPGYFYTLVKALAWENINIIEIVSTLTEMTFALHDKDVPRAYTLVKEIIAKRR
jgi:aspartokinase